MRWATIVFFLAALVLLSGFDATKRGSGGGNSVPGLTPDGVCNDLCVEYLYNLKTFESMPNWAEVYFSADSTGALAEGDDTNPCTRDLPCQDAELIEDYLNRGSIIVYLDSDTWDDAGAGEEMEGFDGFQVSPDCTGVAAGEPCAYLVNLDPEAPATFSCVSTTAVTGLAPNAFWNLQTVGRAGVGNIIAQNCPNLPNGDASFRHAFDTNHGTAKGVFVGTQALDVTSSHSHGFRTSNGGGVYIAVQATGRDLADFDEDCIGGTCAATLCEDTDDPYDCCEADSATPGDAGDSQCFGVGPHLIEINHPTTVVSNKVFDLRATQFTTGGNGPICFLNDCTAGGCHDVVVGPTCRMPATLTEIGAGTKSAALWTHLMPTAAGENTIGYLARASILPAPLTVPADFRSYGQGIGASGSATNANTISFTGFQNTYTGVLFAIRHINQLAGDTINQTERCSLFDGLHQAGGNAFIYTLEGNGGAAIHNIDIDGSNYYDTDDGGANPDSFNFANVESKTATGVSIADAGGASAEVFNFASDEFFGTPEAGPESTTELGTGGVDADAFSDGTDDFGASVTANLAQVRNATCPYTQTIPLSAEATIPASVTRAGIVIKTLLLGTHYDGVGAR